MAMKYKTFNGKKYRYVGNISYSYDIQQKGKHLKRERDYWRIKGFSVRTELVETNGHKYYKIYVRKKETKAGGRRKKRVWTEAERRKKFLRIQRKMIKDEAPIGFYIDKYGEAHYRSY